MFWDCERILQERLVIISYNWLGWVWMGMSQWIWSQFSCNNSFSAGYWLGFVLLAFPYIAQKTLRLAWLSPSLSVVCWKQNMVHPEMILSQSSNPNLSWLNPIFLLPNPPRKPFCLTFSPLRPCGFLLKCQVLLRTSHSNGDRLQDRQRVGA